MSYSKQVKGEAVTRDVDVDEEGSVVSEPVPRASSGEAVHLEGVTTPHVCEDVFCDMKTVEQDIPPSSKQEVQPAIHKKTQSENVPPTHQR